MTVPRLKASAFLFYGLLIVTVGGLVTYGILDDAVEDSIIVGAIGSCVTAGAAGYRGAKQDD